MTLIALVGDCTTTTTIALATAFPDGDDALVVEADRSGGTVAAWFDTPVAPTLSTLVAGLRGADRDAASTWEQIEGLSRRSRSGVWFVPAPVRSTEANQAIDQAERVIFPTIALRTTGLVDVGRRTAADGIPPVLRLADTTIICHRQATASAAAAAVRLERAAELVELLAAGTSRIIVAVIGDEPFDLTEIHDYLVDAASTTAIETHQLAVDELAAAVIGGRHGVSAKRFARLPLIRSAAGLLTLLRATAVDAGANAT